ncbi:MAG: tetratricopeptide repeat protein [Desulfonatronovibrio sp.]
MPKQKTRTKTGNKGNQALQSLLNDQAEARMKKEISISRSKSGTKDRGASGKSENKPDSTTAGSASRLESQSQARDAGLKMQPTMKETKAQLIERMNRILQQFHKLEASLEQKDLERENVEKDMKKMASELQKLSSGKDSLKEQNIQKDKLLRTADDKINQLEKTVQSFEKQVRDLKSSLMDMENEVKELVSTKEKLDRDCAEKEEAIRILKQEVQRLEKEDQNKGDKAAGEDHETSADHVYTDASAWRARADELWNGSSYLIPQKALYYLNAALDLRPDWPEALNDRGLASLDEGRLDDAIEDFTTAVALKNQFAEAYHNRGVALLRAGKKFAAKKDFQTAARYGLEDDEDVLQSAGA